MNIDEFQRNTSLRRFVEEKLPDMIRDRLSDCRIESVYARNTRKNNGQVLLGLYVQSEDRDLAPCIYVEPYIPPDPSILKEEGIWDRIADRIAGDFRYALDVIEPKTEELYRPEDVSEHLILKLINRQKNEELLQNYPYRSFLDLAVLLEWEVICGRRKGMIHISQEVLDSWGRSFDEMYEIALANTMRKYPLRIAPLGCILADLSEGRFPNEESPFYYVGTVRGLQGGVAILYPGLLKEVYRQIGEAYYLIPSSINELLALPCSYDSDQVHLMNLVWDVNTFVLDRADILSDSLYLYHPEEDRLEMITQKC